MSMSMSLSQGLNSLLAIFAFASVSLASNQAVLGGKTVAAPQITGNPSVVDHYNQEFINAHLANQLRVQNVGAWCSGCDQSPQCCPMGGWSIMPAPTTTSQQPISTPITTIQPCECEASSTPKPPAPSSWTKLPLPTTVLSADPAWETLFRHSTTDNTPSPPPASIPASIQFNNDKASPDTLHDITNTYYTFTIEGHHPFNLPLILQTGTDKTPITLLATANLNQQHSFISSSLLTHLGLASQIRPTPRTPSNPDLLQILDTMASIKGTITLDILAGRNDRHLPATQFLVFEPVSAQEHGPLRPDVVVGMAFLNRAGALQLTSEYAGVGAKEGLGIVVQKVYGAEASQKVNLNGGEEERFEL